MVNWQALGVSHLNSYSTPTILSQYSSAERYQQAKESQPTGVVHRYLVG